MELEKLQSLKENRKMNVGMYTGSFDPVTNGHLDIIERGAKIFDKLYIAVVHNVNKKCLFSLEERCELLRIACKDIPNVEVVICDKLAVQFAKEIHANTILRGLRALTDFEYELQMATTNHELDPNIETIFMMTNSHYSFLSSSAVKEIAAFNGDNSKFIPEVVQKALSEKFK